MRNLTKLLSGFIFCALAWSFCVSSFAEGGTAEDKRTFQRNLVQAKNHHADAQTNVGLAYLSGVGVVSNVAEGFRWLKLAAKNGDPFGQYWLAVYYESGHRGLAQDKTQAMKLYQAAAEQGLAVAQTKLARGYLLGEGVAKSGHKAEYWFKKSAEQGEMKAPLFLGAMYYQGEGVDQNYQRAREWFEKVADYNEIACYYLGEMYANGQGVAQDDSQAFKWYQQSAELYYAPALRALGEMYEAGRGVASDLEKAKSWYQLACEKEDAQACEQLARLSKKGG